MLRVGDRVQVVDGGDGVTRSTSGAKGHIVAKDSGILLVALDPPYQKEWWYEPYMLRHIKASDDATRILLELEEDT